MIEAIKAALDVLEQQMTDVIKERDKLFEHSVMLNQVCYKVSLALGYMKDGEDYASELSPVEVVQELIDQYDVALQHWQS